MITDQQRAERASYIGGSDAPAIAGVCPYRQPTDSWAEKVGLIEPPDLTENEAVEMGSRFEAPIRDAAAERLGVTIHQVHRDLIHPDFSFIRGHVDGRIVGRREGIEIKNRNLFARNEYGTPGTDQVLESDIIQTMHYLACTGWELMHLAVVFGGQKLVLFRIPRDQALIDELTAMEVDFWRHVQERTPPAIDFAHARAPELVRKLYPGTNGQTVTLPERATELHEAIRAQSAAASAAEKQAKAARAELMAMLGESAVGLLPDGSGGYARKLVQRKGYTVEPTEYVDFRFSAKAGQQ